MKTLNNQIEDKEDLAPQELISIKQYQSSELDVLIKHLNGIVYECTSIYPDQFPYLGNFKYLLTLYTYRDSYKFKYKLFYEYKGNIVFEIANRTDNSFTMTYQMIDMYINSFNKECYSWIMTLNVKEIIKGTIPISYNPNHFFYNMTYIDITKLKTIKQEKLFNDEKV